MSLPQLFTSSCGLVSHVWAPRGQVHSCFGLCGVSPLVTLSWQPWEEDPVKAKRGVTPVPAVLGSSRTTHPASGKRGAGMKHTDQPLGRGRQPHGGSFAQLGGGFWGTSWMHPLCHVQGDADVRYLCFVCFWPCSSLLPAICHVLLTSHQGLVT